MSADIRSIGEPRDANTSLAEMRTAASALIERMQFARQAGMSFNGFRDMYDVLGYDRVLQAKMYRERYRRGGLAGRIVEAMPKATWRGGLELIEDEDPKVSTTFEKAWEELEKRLHITSTFLKADILAGQGQYAVMLIGAPGELSSELEKGSPDKLVYLTPFSEEDARIQEWDTDIKSARFGLPTSYLLSRMNANSLLPGAAGVPTFSSDALTRPVHWTRLIHIAEGTLDNEVFGQPTLERVWNLLDDLDKVTGGGAEAFWLRANQGVQLNVDKDMQISPAEKEELRNQADEYQHQIRRMLRTRGVEVNTLGSDVANFTGPADAILTQIAGAKSVPKRILTGSEMGELASSQDRDNWKDQINGRQSAYAAPYIVRPFVDRLIDYKYLPKPKEYDVKWSHIQTLTEQEKADGAQKWGLTTTAEGPVFNRDEIRDKWYAMEPWPKPILDEETGEHTSPESGLPVAPTMDPHTGLPLKVEPPPTVAVDPATGLPVEIDTKAGVPVHQSPNAEEGAANAVPRGRPAVVPDPKKPAQLPAAKMPSKTGVPPLLPFAEAKKKKVARAAEGLAPLLHALEQAIITNDTKTIDRIVGTQHALQEYSYSSTQVNLPDEVAGVLYAFAQTIPDTDLLNESDESRERNAHVTIKYGIHTSDPAPIRAIFNGVSPIEVMLGPTWYFEAEDHDVLYASVDSPDLEALNAKVANSIEVTDTFPIYTPHCTIAYLKKGLGPQYAGQNVAAGYSATVEEVVFSTADDEEYFIKLNGPRTLGGPGSGWTKEGGHVAGYHVTDTKNIKSITKKGLQTMHPSQWIKAGDKSRYGEGEVYAFEHKDDAIRWAGKMDWAKNESMGTGKISIVEIDAGDWKDWMQDQSDPLSQAGSAGKWYKKHGGIKPEAIKGHHPVTIEHIRELTKRQRNLSDGEALWSLVNILHEASE